MHLHRTISFFLDIVWERWESTQGAHTPHFVFCSFAKKNCNESLTINDINDMKIVTALLLLASVASGLAAADDGELCCSSIVGMVDLFR